MDYESLTTLDQLLNDSSATEFHDEVNSIPVDKSETDFYAWIDSEALPNWGSDYVPMLTALRRLVAAELSFSGAMTEIGALQDTEEPEEDEAEDIQEEPPADEAAEDEEEQVEEPGEAAKKVVEDITAPIIAQFQAEYPEIAARLTPEQLSAAAIKATAAAVSQQ
jgi:hypothetical protein